MRVFAGVVLVLGAVGGGCSPAPAVPETDRGAERLERAVMRLERAVVRHTEVLERALKAPPASVDTRAPVAEPDPRPAVDGAVLAGIQKTMASIEALLRTSLERGTVRPSTAGEARPALQPMAAAPTANIKERFATTREAARALALMTYEDVLRVLGAPHRMSGKEVNWLYPNGIVSFVDGYVSHVHFSDKADWRDE